MTENDRRLTFSQRNGLAPIPQPLKLGEITDGFRIDLHNIVSNFFDKNILAKQINYIETICEFNEQTNETLLEIHCSIFVKPIDEFLNLRDILNFYKSIFLEKDWGEYVYNYAHIFDVIEGFMRFHPRKHFDFPLIFKELFKKHALAYTIVDEGCPTIVPAATPEEGETIHQAFEAAKEDKYEPVRKHLRNSAEQINANHPADAIRESIHAVESVLRIVTGEKDFSKALQVLEKSYKMHPALKDAFKKLYGYTSDEQGIRHALIDQPESSATMDEAVFMLGACAAFVGYVIRKSSALSAVAAPAEGVIKTDDGSAASHRPRRPPPPSRPHRRSGARHEVKA